MTRALLALVALLPACELTPAAPGVLATGRPVTGPLRGAAGGPPAAIAAPPLQGAAVDPGRPFYDGGTLSGSAVEGVARPGATTAPPAGGGWVAGLPLGAGGRGPAGSGALGSGATGPGTLPAWRGGGFAAPPGFSGATPSGLGGVPPGGVR